MNQWAVLKYVNGVKKKTISENQNGDRGEAFTERGAWLFAPKEMEIEIRPIEDSKGKEIYCCDWIGR